MTLGKGTGGGNRGFSNCKKVLTNDTKILQFLRIAKFH